MFGADCAWALPSFRCRRASYATSSRHRTDGASSIFSTQRQVGVSWAWRSWQHPRRAHVAEPAATADEVASALTGVRWAFGVAVLALTAGVLALFIRDEDAAATMVPANANRSTGV
jgi:hypothetical protein